MDYGKLAYAKTQELSRRISNLSSSSGGQKTLSKTLYGITTAIGERRSASFSFAASKREEITITLYASALSGENFNGEGIIKVNGYDALPFPITLKKDVPCFLCASKRVTAEEGGVEVSLEIENQDITFLCLMFCACGEKIAYASIDVKTLFAAGTSKNYFAALWGSSVQVFSGQGESSLNGTPDLYTFEKNAEQAKLFVTAQGLNCLYLSRGKLYHALLDEEGEVVGKEICGNVSAFDYLEFDGEKYLFAVIRTGVFLLKLNAQFEAASQEALPTGGKTSFVKCAKRGQKILLAVEEGNIIKLYLSKQGGFDAAGALPAKGLADLKSDGNALLTKSGGLFFIHTFDQELNASSSPLIFCGDACFAESSILLSEENQLSLRTI